MAKEMKPMVSMNAKLKRMVEDWEGRKLPKNVSMKTLLDRLAQERWATEVERSASYDRE